MKKPTPTRPDLTGVHLWLLLWKAGKAVEAHARRSVNTTGLCLSDFGVLEALLHKGPLPINALGNKVLLSSGSMTAAVDRLERSGFVKRGAAATDRRARIVHLTEKGSKLIRSVFARHERDMERVFSRLEKPERNALADLLRKLGHEAESMAAEERIGRGGVLIPVGNRAAAFRWTRVTEQKKSVEKK
ncbi:MAG TPA: MarR family transcriptional regulator [Bryobacteraceae bacterium]|nr:MarR family transcriptional regulator [Bryobacteraceae bacterium]